MNRFLKILASSNRIDLLIVIQKPLLELKQFIPQQNARNIENFMPQMTDTIDSGIFPNFKEIINDSQQFILILHHELRQSSDLRKSFKWLIHNLKAKCPSNFTILDINNCYDEQNLHGIIQKIFEKANQILLVASVDYKHDVLENNSLESSNYKVKLKYFVHELMNNEYIHNGMRNQRFRIVVPNGTNPTAIPLGWATNTIQYAFPQAFEELCKKLFFNEST